MKKKGKSSRKRSIILLSLISILLVFTLVFTFLPFSYGEGVKEYKSVVGIIKKGIDVNGGTYAILKPIPPSTELAEYNDNLSANIDSSIKILQSRLLAKGYTDATVVKQTTQDGYSIRIEIPEVDNPDSVLGVITKTAVLEFRDPNDVVIIDNSHVKKAITAKGDTSYLVGLRLTKEGNEKFSKATLDNVGNSIGIYVDGELYTSVSITQQITSDPVISGYTYETANDFAMQLNSGMLPLNFGTVESNAISPAFGENTLKMILIAGVIGVGLIFILLGIFYKGMGIASSLSLLVFFVVLLFLMSQLPWVRLTLAAVAGIVLGLILFISSSIVVFERIKEEYAEGKSLISAVNAGFRRSLAVILDSHIAVLILSILLWILGAGAVQSFAITLFLSVIVSFVCSLVISRVLLKLLLPINGKPKFYNLKRGEVAENE